MRILSALHVSLLSGPERFLCFHKISNSYILLTQQSLPAFADLADALEQLRTIEDFCRCWENGEGKEEYIRTTADAIYNSRMSRTG